MAGFLQGFQTGQNIVMRQQQLGMLKEDRLVAAEDRKLALEDRQRAISSGKLKAAKQQRIQDYRSGIDITQPLAGQESARSLLFESPEDYTKVQTAVSKMNNEQRVATHARTMDMAKMAATVLKMPDARFEKEYPSVVAAAQKMGVDTSKFPEGGTTQQKRFAMRMAVNKARKVEDILKPEKTPEGYRPMPDGSYSFVPGGPADPKVKQALAEAGRAPEKTIERIGAEAAARRAPVKSPEVLAKETEAVEKVKAKYRDGKTPFAGLDAQGKPAMFRMDGDKAVVVEGIRPIPRKGQVVQVDADGNVTIASDVDPGVFGKTDKKSRRDLDSARTATMQAIAGAGELKDLLTANPDALTTAGDAARIGQAVLADAKATFRALDMDINAEESADAYADTFSDLGITNARAQSVITNLAFAAAASSGQTGRAVSNRDITRFIKEIGGGYNDPKARAAIIDDFVARISRNYNIRHNIVMGEEFEGSLTLGGAGETTAPQTQADFDKLKPGTLYIDPEDGKKYRKQ